ncbi:MAG: carbonic anhydrase family protein [Bacteroidota bacterium]
MKTKTDVLSTKNLMVLLLSLSIVMTSCNNDNTLDVECFDDFNYDDTTDEGPASWFNYCTDDGTINECGSTTRQSPIDISGVVNDPTLQSLSTLYANSITEIINNGHTLQFNYNGTGTVNFQGSDYSLQQFHFHANSEHTIEGSHKPLEAHLVHKNDSGHLMVLGIFFEIGAESTFLAQFIDNLPEEINETYLDFDLSYNASGLLPANLSYYHYKGSLTTPPCSEIVEWIVMKNALEMSQTQMDQFSGILHHNFRPVQPLAGRVIGAYDVN